MTLPSLHRLMRRCDRAGIPPARAAALVRGKQALLVDIGEQPAWLEGVAKGAQRLPLSDFLGERNLWGPFLAKIGDKPLLVYDRDCRQTAAAVRALQAAGIDAMDAGTLSEWDAAGWPVCRPPRNR